MADYPAADLLLPQGRYDEGDYEGEEYEDGEAAAAAQEAKMQEALALNQQLKMMMQMAEEQEAEAARQRVAARQQQRAGARAPPPQQNNRRQLGHAKNGGWGGMTFTEGRANEINRDNAILVSKLSNIHIERKKPNASMVAQPFRIAASRTAAAINRRKQDEKIARENAALAKRLNSVKPTKSLSSKATQQHAAQHSQLLRVLQPGRAGPSTEVRMAPRGPPRARSAGGPRPPQSMLPALRGQSNEPRPFEF